jgi:hypothetical protein
MMREIVIDRKRKEVVINRNVILSYGSGGMHIERGYLTLVADVEQTITFDKTYSNTNYFLQVNAKSLELGKDLIYDSYPEKLLTGFKIKAIGDCDAEYLAVY